MPVPSGFTLILDSGSSTRFAVTRILRAMATPDFRVNVVREHYAGARGAAIGKAPPLRPGRRLRVRPRLRTARGRAREAAPLPRPRSRPGRGRVARARPRARA